MDKSTPEEKDFPFKEEAVVLTITFVLFFPTLFPLFGLPLPGSETLLSPLSHR